MRIIVGRLYCLPGYEPRLAFLNFDFYILLDCLPGANLSRTFLNFYFFFLSNLKFEILYFIGLFARCKFGQDMNRA